MSDFAISIPSGQSRRLKTGGKYCPADIVVTAESSAGSGLVLCGEATEVGDNAFEDSALTGIKLPRAKSIGNKAFMNCRNLRDVEILSVETIGNDAFRWTDLRTVILDGRVQLGERAFYSCYNLKNVQSSQILHLTLASGTFSDCYSLEEVFGIQQADELPDYVFYRCNAFILPDIPSVKIIGKHACADCYNTSTLYAEQVTVIEDYAFESCESLSFVYVPRLESIGLGAFIGCTALQKIDLPSCTQILDHAFNGCISLSTVILRTTETVCVCSLNAFYDTPMLTGEGHAYVPASMYEMYRAGYEDTINSMMPGFFDIMFRKIEDYPEICG